VGGQEKIVVHEDSKGTYAFLNGAPIAAFIKLSWYQTPIFHYILPGFSLILFLSTIAWIVSALRNRKKGKKVEPHSRWARCVAGWMSILYLIFLICMLIILKNAYDVIYGIPPLLPFALVLPLIAIIPTIGSIYFTVLAWKNSYWSMLGRVHYTLVTLASLVFIWFLNYWNLFGFHF